MTTTQTPPTPTPAPKPSVSKALLFPLSLVTGLAVIFGAGVFFINHTMDVGTESRITHMQSSLESHGITAEGNTAQRVLDACRGTDVEDRTAFKPVSATIVQEHKGKKSVITMMCDDNSGISDFAAIPVP